MSVALRKLNALTIPKSSFKLTEAGSSIPIEVLAGISTFLALSYIFVVNPAILSEGGMNKSAVFFATIIGSVFATLLMGLWANKPFAVAPGLEMNAYVAYVVIGAMGFSWQGAMGAVFWSGVLTVLLNYTGARVRIINAIPDSLKSGLSAAVGVFLMLIALKVSNLLVYKGIDVQGVGSLMSADACVFYSGLALVAFFKYFKVTGAVLLSIVCASLAAHGLGLGGTIEKITLSKEMFEGTMALDFSVILNPKIWSVVLILFILDFYGSIAKFIGLTRNTPIMSPDGTLPQMQEALTVDGLGTVIGAGLGTSNLITYVESAVGIGEGARTGLSAVVCALLMASFLVLTPLINLVPVVATTGALFFVGVMLMPKPADVKAYHWTDIAALVVMIAVTIWTFGLDKAMFAGFATFICGLAVSGRVKQINPSLVISTLLLLASLVLSKTAS